MNIMDDIAELLGVAENEPFKVSMASDDTICWYSNGKFRWKDSRGQGTMNPDVLYTLLEDTSRIIKKPWKPSQGEPYYFVRYTDNLYSSIGTAAWIGDETDLARFHLGNSFETADDALTHRSEILRVFDDIKDEVEAWT